jgi:hypothetical protein
MPRWLVKVVVGLAVLALAAILFMQSVRSTRSEPFDVEAAGLTGWPMVVQPGQDSLGAWLALEPPAQLTMSLGREVFARGGESVNYPTPAVMPLLLQSEFDRVFAGAVPPDDIVGLARAAGFESLTWTPRCMGYRRISEPRAPRAIYFVLFDEPVFDRFRQQLADLLRAAKRDPLLFDPEAVSPTLIVAGLDDNFGSWMPLKADPQVDCLAPVRSLP